MLLSYLYPEDPGRRKRWGNETERKGEGCERREERKEGGKKKGGRSKIFNIVKKFSEPTAIIKFGTFPSFAKTYNIKN